MEVGDQFTASRSATASTFHLRSTTQTTIRRRPSGVAAHWDDAI